MSKGSCGIVGAMAQLVRVKVCQQVALNRVKVLVAFLPLSVQVLSITKIATASISLVSQALALALSFVFLALVWFQDAG